jgi:hypothetical protein
MTPSKDAAEEKIDFEEEAEDVLQEILACPDKTKNEVVHLEEWAKSIARRVEEETIKRACCDYDNSNKPCPVERLYGERPQGTEGK